MAPSIRDAFDTVLRVASDAVAARPRGLVAAIAPLTRGASRTDFAQGALPALLPYLVTRFHLSYLEAA